MPDYLDTLAQDAKETVAEGYYQVSSTQSAASSVSLRKAIIESRRNAVITEVKAASPSRGTIKSRFDPAEVAVAMESGGATGISVLTEPKHFSGSLSYLMKVRETVKLPILMKDIVVSPIQLEAASRIGANVVLLIEAIFDRGYCELSLEEMIKQAHSRELEVLLETHKENEFLHAIETDADLIGINNRDLRTLKVDLHITERILKKHESRNKVVISESGVMTPKDLLFLRGCGAQAFLIGSSVMMAENIEQKVKEFVTAH
jgi:indole-3-glycerol phosphate synthase